MIEPLIALVCTVAFSVVVGRRMARRTAPGVTPPSLDLAPDLVDALRYAEQIVTVGIDPDHPERVVVCGYRDPHPRMCGLSVAHALAEVAQQLTDRHEAEGCGR